MEHAGAADGSVENAFDIGEAGLARASLVGDITDEAIGPQVTAAARTSPFHDASRCLMLNFARR